MSAPLFLPHNDPPLVADGGESVTLLRAGREPGVSIGWAFRRAVPPVRDDRRSPLIRAEAVWTLAESEAPGGIRSGDVLRDVDGRRWVVLAVSPAPAGRLAVWCRDTSAAFEPGSTIDIQVAEFRKGSHGEPLPVWRLFATGVPCRWRDPTDASQEPNGGATRLWVAMPFTEGTYRFRDRWGRMFAIRRIIDPGSLTDPAEIEAVAFGHLTAGDG